MKWLWLALLLANCTLRPSCEFIHGLVGGELVPWLDYPVGWELPSDLEFQDRRDLLGGGGIWTYTSESQAADYVIWFLSYKVDGDPPGAHDFCGPYKIGAN